MHENREASKASAQRVDRSAKAQSHTADMHAMEESDCRVVPVKQPNKEGKPLAEVVEGRRQPKENDAQSNIQPTQRGERASQGLSGVRRVARERKQEQFTALLRHVTVNLLRESFDALGKVRIAPLFQAPDPALVQGASVTFEPGARIAWHTHPLGQTLIVTAGCGWVQREGGPIEDIRPGDVVWFPPDENHWHGATPTAAMTHIAIQERLNGKVVDWMEQVSDAQYRQ
jgi:quercetin dioxygenase-like cupin family protein